MVKILVTLQHDAKRSFDVLQHRELGILNADDTYHFTYPSLEEAKIALQTITLDNSPLIEPLSDPNDPAEYWHFHYLSRHKVDARCLTDTAKEKKLSSSRQEENAYIFSKYQANENVLKSIFHNWIEVKKKLIKKPKVKYNAGHLARSQDWAVDKENQIPTNLSRGYGFIPNTSQHLQADKWQACMDSINNRDQANPKFNVDNAGNISSPGKSSYITVYEMGDVECVVRAKASPSQSILKKARTWSEYKAQQQASIESMPAFFKPSIVSETSDDVSQLARKPLSDTTNLAQRLAALRTSLPTKKSMLKTNFTLTAKKLQKILQEKQDNQNRRICGQNILFDNISANQAAAQLGLPTTFENEPIAYEWTHLGAYEFLGAGAQKKENVVLATAACNTLMMHLEFIIKKYAYQGHRIDAQVKALIDSGNPEKEKFNYAEKILYSIKVDDKHEFNFEFDPRSPIVPPKEVYLAIDGYMQFMMQNDVKSTAVLPICQMETVDNIALRTAEVTNQATAPAIFAM